MVERYRYMGQPMLSRSAPAITDVFGVIDGLDVPSSTRPFWGGSSIRKVMSAPPAIRPTQRHLLYIDDITAAPVHSPNDGPISCRHRQGEAVTNPALWCFFSDGIAVSGNGMLWIGDDVLAIPDLMPSYWRDRVSGASKESTPEIDVFLPTRMIDGPCISALGWGGKIYGHVLLEMIPRVILALKICAELKPKVLLRSDTPKWLQDILLTIGIDGSRIEWFEPSQERVLLSNGIYPGYPGTHPVLADLFDTVDTGPAKPRKGFYYLTRKAFLHRRGCTNEANLERIAREEYGAIVVAPEDLPWIEQVRLFRSARAVISLYGSALHTALLSDGGLTVASIGVINVMQSSIANIRGQRLAYQVAGFTVTNSYAVPEDGFRQLMDAIVTA